MEKQVTGELAGLYPFIKDEGSLPMALCKISGTTGSKFIVLIDERDALFREAKEATGLQRDYIQLLRGMFKSSMTDMLSPKRLAKYTGFTEAEVKQLCETYDMDFEEAKRWYDGYSFHGTESIYNPNAIVQAMENGEFGNYWTETETYESLKVYVLTLLVHLGYLAYEADTKSVYIPNEEIRQEFMRAVKYGRHIEIAELIVASDRLLQDTFR